MLLLEKKVELVALMFKYIDGIRDVCCIPLRIRRASSSLARRLVGDVHSFVSIDSFKCSLNLLRNSSDTSCWLLVFSLAVA